MTLQELEAKENIGRTIKKQARKNNEVLFGARALNAQVIGFLRKKTFDYDLYADKPKRSARKLERKLDRKSGRNIYYTKQAIHESTRKVMHKGPDLIKGTKDDFGVADYSEKPKGLTTVTINGVKYASLQQIRKNRLKAIRNPEAAFRRSKDIEALNTIKADKLIKKKIGL